MAQPPIKPGGPMFRVTRPIYCNSYANASPFIAIAVLNRLIPVLNRPRQPIYCNSYANASPMFARYSSKRARSS